MEQMDKGTIKKVAVIGLGYVGLPLAVTLARTGYEVIGVDLNRDWVEKVNKGISNIGDVPSEILGKMVTSGKIKAYTTYKEIEKAQAVIICVPTPLTHEKSPDLSYIIKSVDLMLPHLKKQTLISLESTTYPGTTNELIVSRIEKEKGWIPGKDFYVCYSPERVDPGNKKFNVENTPKVVGGSTESCLEKGAAFYKTFLPAVIQVGSTEVAEMTKLLENTFRCINIALMNEMTMMCERMGIDIWEVIRGAASKPFGFMPFYPGPGVGGHCIPLDPLYLAWQAKRFNYFNRFIELASDINSNMPYYVVSQINKILSQQGKPIKESRILLVGVSYKKDIGDLRESPALVIAELLLQAGVKVEFYDPYIHSLTLQNRILTGIDLKGEVLEAFDLVTIVTDHSQIDYDLILEKSKIIYDTRNVYRNVKEDKIFKLGQRIR